MTTLAEYKKMLATPSRLAQDRRSSKRRGQLRETDIVRSCLEYLALNRFGYFWRSNTGAFAAEHNGKRRFVRFGAVGSPDILGCLDGKMICIEVKNKTGDQSRGQVEFQRRIEKAGGTYFVARSVADLMERGL